MVSDKNKKYVVSENQLENLIDNAYVTSIDILLTCNNIANDFDKSKGNQTEYFCAGLYTHALEEYGKILWLNERKKQIVNDKVEIDYSKYGGKEAHTTKFNMIKQDKALPDILKKLGGEKWGVGGNIDTAIAILQRQEPITPYTRFQIFYSDFDDSGNPIPYPQVDKESLAQSISKFLKFLIESQQKFRCEVEERRKK